MKGPLRPGWSWTLEASLYHLRAETIAAFDQPSIADSRELADALVFGSPALARMALEEVHTPIRGHWYTPRAGARDLTVLYLHGGGYAYYARSHQNLIALVAEAAEARTFALDYRLIPEHPYPAQLEDALAAYRWLLEAGITPARLVVMGDSAGGNLTLALLLKLRESGLPFPALACCLGPWTDVSGYGESLLANERTDWVQKRMTVRWAEWFCAGRDPKDPGISPVYADLRGLPPIYVQAGGAEILFDMIRRFVEVAREQGAVVQFDTWPTMPHDFQAYGELVPEAQEALQRLREVVREQVKASAAPESA